MELLGLLFAFGMLDRGLKKKEPGMTTVDVEELACGCGLLFIFLCYTALAVGVGVLAGKYLL